MATAVSGRPAAVNPWLSTLTLMLGTLAAVLGASTINTALPDIMSGLGINQEQVSWVATAYMLANVIAIPSAAWLGAWLSQRVLFGAGMAVFLAGSIACGFSWDFGSMIAFRILQGLGAGLVMPTAQSLMLQVFPPEERGAAMGVFGMGAIMGPAIGPTVGGYLVALFGWRSIFFINLPFVAAGMLLLWTLPRAPRRTDMRFDTPGFVSMVLFLSTLQIAVSNGAKDGWSAPYILGCFVTAGLSLAYLLYRELTTEEPLLDLSVFKSAAYSTASLVSVVLGLGLFGSTFLVPVFLGAFLGYNALQIGLILLPGSFLMGLTMLVAGRLSDRFDGRYLIGAGLALFAFGLWLQGQADAASPQSLHVWAQVWRGLGMGLVFSPLTAVSMAGLPMAQIPQATGLLNLTRQLAGTIGIAALNTFLSTRSAMHASALGQGASAEDPAVQAFLGQACQLLVERGLAPDAAPLGAFSLLGQLLGQRVMVLAYADVFWVLTAVCLGGALLVVFLPAPRRRGRP